MPATLVACASDGADEVIADPAGGFLSDRDLGAGFCQRIKTRRADTATSSGGITWVGLSGVVPSVISIPGAFDPGKTGIGAAGPEPSVLFYALICRGTLEADLSRIYRSS